jgi:hypothetical protein
MAYNEKVRIEHRAPRASYSSRTITVEQPKTSKEDCRSVMRTSSSANNISPPDLREMLKQDPKVERHGSTSYVMARGRRTMLLFAHSLSEGCGTRSSAELGNVLMRGSGNMPLSALLESFSASGLIQLCFRRIARRLVRTISRRPHRAAQVRRPVRYASRGPVHNWSATVLESLFGFRYLLREDHSACQGITTGVPRASGTRMLISLAFKHERKIVLAMARTVAPFGRR